MKLSSPHRRALVPLCTAGLLLRMILGLASAQTPAPYTALDLGTLGGTTSYAWNVNNLGQVSGESYPDGSNLSHATLFNTAGGVVTRVDLGQIPSSYSTAYSLNNAGQLVGSVFRFFGATSATLWSVNNGSISRAEYTPTTGYYSYAYGINDAGLFVGSIFVGSNGPQHPALFTANSAGTISPLDLSAGTGDGVAYAINNAGQIVGSDGNGNGIGGRATLYTVKGTAVSRTDLGLPGDSSSTAWAINQAGQIAGTYTDNQQQPHAALYTVDAGTVTRTDLYQGTAYTMALGLNNSGQVVGTIAPPKENGVPFLYTQAEGLRDLNTLIATGGAVTHLDRINYGNPINDFGQIAVSGTVGGQTHAILLSPTKPVSIIKGLTQEARLLAGVAYNQVPTFQNPNSQSVPELFALLDGVAGSGGSSGTYGTNRSLSATFTTNPSTIPVVKDPVDFQGTGSDAVVVQLAYDRSEAGTLFGDGRNFRLGWFDGKRWRLAVEGNTGGTSLFVGNRAYNPATDFHVGTHGVDLAKATAWAVVNHGGLFGVSLDPVALQKIASFSHDLGRYTYLTLDSYQGHTYQLQRAAKLGDGGGFVDVGSLQTGGITGGKIEFKYTDAPGTPQGFFRVRIDP